MNLARWLQQTITVAEPTGSRNANGDPVFGAQVSRRARVEAKTSLVRRADGTERRSDAVVYLDQAISTGARVWLPGALTTSTNAAREVLAVASSRRLHGSETLWEARV